MTEYDYSVTHLDSATDITDQIETITCTDVGSGEINSAVIRLYSFEGQFIRAAPILDEFQKIQITITDEDANVYDRIYEVHTIIPIESSQEGNVVEVELLGQEWHLGRSYFAKQFYFESGYEVVRDIGDQYNEVKGTLQPTLEDHDNNVGNQLPKWTSNFYDFNIAEKRVYDGMTQVVDRLGNTVAAGGGGDFWELYFQNGTDSGKIEMRGFVSGINPPAGQEITITDADEVNADPSEGGISATQGTVVAAWGDPQAGTFPSDASRFHGELEAFYAIGPWVDPASSGQNYPTDALVTYLGTTYISLTDNNATNPTTPGTWIFKVVADFLGSTVYSPWTNTVVDMWRNSGSNPANSPSLGFGESGFWDGNLVVWDLNHYRTHVIAWVASYGGIPAEYFYAGNQSATGAYRTMRILVDSSRGALQAPFNGNDPNGVAYDKNIAQFDGTNWIVKRVTQNGEEVAVTHMGAVLEKIAGVWTDIHTTSRANDCFHGYSSLINTAGVNNTLKSGGGTYGDTSAIQVTYSYVALSTLALVTNDANYYKSGVWLDIRIPYPMNSYNGETIGSLYGNNVTKKEPVTLDSNNMHLTPSGLVGFNNSESAELGPLNALSFTAMLEWIDPNGALALAGDFKFRCYLYDSSDNVVSQDFTISFNQIWEDISLPLTEFQIYRARIPYRYELDNIAAAFVLDDLDIVNRFEWKNIKQISIQCQEPYDDQGRYVPELCRFNTSDVFASLATGGGASTLAFTIDRINFTKPLLAISPPVTDRPLFLEFRQQPLISNFKQLEQDAESFLQVAQFRHRQYDIRTEGKIDIPYGSTYFLNKADLVPDDDTRTADSGGNANTIRLVNKKTVYKIIKSGSESGNFLRYITGIKRIIE